MKISAIQCDLAWEDAEENRRHTGELIDQAAGSGAGLVMLPEMFPTGFSMATDRIAEPPDGPTAAFLHGHAESNGVWVGGSFACHADEHDKPTNRFLVAGPGGEQVIYDKVHPFSYGDEADHYAAGTESVSFTVDGVRVTPFICYDLRFADWFWHAAEMTDCYVVVANWPAACHDHWGALLRARAIENLAYVVGVNRVGIGGGVTYVGGSVVFDPFGEVVAEAGSTERILSSDVEAGRVAEVRNRYPFLADR